MTDSDQELIELLQTKSPEELTVDEIERLRAALVHSVALQQALAGRLEMEQYLNAALGTPALSADHIIASAERAAPSAGRGLLSALKWAVCLLLVGFLVAVLIVAVVMPPVGNEREVAQLAGEKAGKAGAEDVAAPQAEVGVVGAKGMIGEVGAGAGKAGAEGAAAPQADDGAVGKKEPMTEKPRDEKPADEKPADVKPAIVVEPGPWPNPAVLAAQSAPSGAEALDDFSERTLAPTETDLQQWFAKVANRAGTMVNHKASNTACSLIEGLLRLRSPWGPGVALRFTAQEHYKLQVHLWQGDRGLTLHYYENVRRGWFAYETTRKAGSPVPESWQLVGSDEGRNARVNSLDPSTFDLSCDGKLCTLSRGNIRLLSVPFEGQPTEAYFEGKAVMRQLQLVRAVELPEEPAPGPIVRDVRHLANENWLTQLGEGAAFNKLPDGSVELQADKTATTARIALPTAADRLQEIVLQVEEPQPGSGIYWGDETGKPFGSGLGFFRDNRTRQLVVQAGNTGGGNPATQVDVASLPVSFCGSKPWIKLLTGCGSVRAWMSDDGLHWVRACDAWMNQQNPVASIGVYCFPDKQPRGIKLRRVTIRDLAAINSLPPAELRRQVPAFGVNENYASWLQAVYGSQPAGVETAAWRMACAVQTLATNAGDSQARALVFDNLLTAAVASDRPWPERLQTLQEAAAICPCWDDTAAAQRILLRFAQLGSVLAREGNAEALATVARAQMAAPIWSRSLVPVADEANRDQILRLAYGHEWPALYDLCSQLRFGRRNVPRQPVLMDWAEALAAQQVPQHATAGSALMRGDWRHPLVAELSKEAYNLLAELQAALEGKSYRDACQIISTAGNQAGPGVLPDSRDPDLLVSLSGAVNQAMREHPTLRATMNEQFGPVGRLRIQQAIGDDDAAAVEAGTVQFTGTEAAAEAQVWLGDRAQATGAFAQALGHYREAIRSAAPSLRSRAVAGAQLAAAMMGQTFADEAVGPADFGDVQLGTSEFSALLGDMRSRRATENSLSLASIASPPAAAPQPTGYDLQVRARWDGDAGDSPDKVPGEVQQFQVDWVARQLAAVVAGERIFLSNRFQVSCFNAAAGKFDWRTMLGGEPASTHDWPLMPMRPLVSAGRIFVRRLPKPGPQLACLDTATGKVLWTSRAERDKFVVSDPLLIQDELFALTVTRAEQELSLSLCTYDPATGAVLAESPLVRLRDHWWQQRTCQVLALDDTFVVACGGSVFRADLMGRIRWLRKETWLPTAINRNWVVQEQGPPIEAGGRLFVTQPGVLDVACLEAETGRLHWQQPVPDLRRIVGVADGRVLVQTQAGFAAFDAADGKPLWEHAAAGVLEGRLFGGPSAGEKTNAGGLLYARSVPVGDEKLFNVSLEWLDPATGHVTAAWPLEALRHERPQVGPVLAVGQRLWTFFGRGDKDPHRDLIELTPKNTAALPGPTNESAGDRRWQSVDPALLAAAGEVLPQWTVLSGTVVKDRPLRLNEWHGETNVFQNPTAMGLALRLARRVKLPADKPGRLTMRVSSDAKWRLDVDVNGKSALSEAVEPAPGGGWKDIDVSLAPFAGQTVWLIVRQKDEDGKQTMVRWKAARLVGE